MNKTERRKLGEIFGLDTDELNRISKYLRKWHEWECNGEIEQDEKTGKYYSVNTFTMKRYPRRDTYTGKVNEAKKYADKHGCSLQINGDPRGCAVRLIKDGREYCFY